MAHPQPCTLLLLALEADPKISTQTLISALSSTSYASVYVYSATDIILPPGYSTILLRSSLPPTIVGTALVQASLTGITGLRSLGSGKPVKVEFEGEDKGSVETSEVWVVECSTQIKELGGHSCGSKGAAQRDAVIKA
ncbi:hypothetical protein MNV49_001843 [Pseudohyphozyma bogoriensis]|nr:hypothetical protein MNV49_001843 [Pseudohyphozyma bogoriensis]